MMEVLLKVLPFREQYPSWVRVVVSGWVMLSAALVVVLIIVRRDAPLAAPGTKQKDDRSTATQEPPPPTATTLPASPASPLSLVGVEIQFSAKHRRAALDFRHVLEGQGAAVELIQQEEAAERLRKIGSSIPLKGNPRALEEIERLWPEGLSDPGEPYLSPILKKILVVIAE